MGQRFQSVFILPEIFMGDNNPNNRSEKVMVFHNQWLYGRGAININLAIMERLKKAISKRALCGIYGKSKKDFINHFLEKSLLNAVKYSSLKELHNETNFHEPAVLIYSEEEKKPKKDQTSLKELLTYQDNNNGFFICMIDKDLNLSYGFLNGFEDKETISLLTPKEYIKLFYSDEDLKEGGFFKFMENQYKKFKKFKEIGKPKLNPIIKHLNKKKPDWAVC